MTFDRNPLQQLIPQRIWAVDQRLKPLIVARSEALVVRGGPVTSDLISLQRATKQRMRPVTPGERFGEPGDTWQQRWFVIEIPPAKRSERGQRYLRWDCDGEATAYLNGSVWAGFDIAHREHLLPDSGGTIYLASGTWQTAIWHADNKRWDRAWPPQFHAAEIVVRDPIAWTAWHDFRALRELMGMWLKDAGWEGSGSFGYSAPLHTAPAPLRRLLRGLDAAVDAFDREGLSAFAEALTGLLKAFRGNADLGRAELIGHAHLDLVWLWPEAVTEAKGVHTFASMLRLMERYPEFVFSQSSPALYQAIERLDPKLSTAVKTRIDEGRWEATGAMMVEADVTLPSGEGLARSLIYGQQRFTELRGEPSKLLWIPDVFGYSTCLPQLLRQVGVEWFFTTKLTWSAVTKFPHSSLNWRGNDGSEILTHLCPTGYNGEADISTMRQAMADNQQSAEYDGVLLPIGYGDGAGGTTEAQIERARRFADLAGSPRASWTTGEAFFGRLNKVRSQLPTFQGELYLEYHRGTYTSQSDFKAEYRRAERALQAHEAALVLTGQPALPAAAWERLLFAQFHDAIPGSSIKIVYDQMVPELRALADQHEAEAQRLIRSGRRRRGVLVTNPLPIANRVVISLPDGDHSALSTPDGVTVPVQQAASGEWLASVDLAGLGSARLVSAETPQAVTNPLTVTTTELANDRVQASFADGQLQRLVIDGAALDLRGSGFRLYPDYPAAFDAWDIDRATMALGEPCLEALSLKVVERGPVRAVLAGRGKLGDGSTAEVRYVLAAGSDQLEVEVLVDWQEQHRLLKFHCATGYCGSHARFGAPFTSVCRPQVPGHQSDESQWEVAGSRWAAVTDDDGITGLAMISECRYGYSCRDGDLAMSLLRSPTYPDPVCDQGRHHLRLALGWYRPQTTASSLSTAAAAEAVYATTLVVSGGELLPSPLAMVEAGSLAPAAVKPAEDGLGVVVRLHECAGSRGTAVIELADRPKRVELVDLTERRQGRLQRIDQHRYAVDYQPYQIVSLRVVPAD